MNDLMEHMLREAVMRAKGEHEKARERLERAEDEVANYLSSKADDGQKAHDALISVRQYIVEQLVSIYPLPVSDLDTKSGLEKLARALALEGVKAHLDKLYPEAIEEVQP